jgi:hypothetical protein
VPGPGAQPRTSSVHITPYQLSVIGQALWQFDLRNRKLQTASQTSIPVRLCNTHKEYIPKAQGRPQDYNTNTENDILDPKPKAGWQNVYL